MRLLSTRIPPGSTPNRRQRAIPARSDTRIKPMSSRPWARGHHIATDGGLAVTQLDEPRIRPGARQPEPNRERLDDRQRRPSGSAVEGAAWARIGHTSGRQATPMSAVRRHRAGCRAIRSHGSRRPPRPSRPPGRRLLGRPRPMAPGVVPRRARAAGSRSRPSCPRHPGSSDKTSEQEVAAAGAKIERTRKGRRSHSAIRFASSGLDQGLAVGARIEGGRRDGQLEAPEFSRRPRMRDTGSRSRRRSIMRVVTPRFGRRESGDLARRERGLPARSPKAAANSKRASRRGASTPASRNRCSPARRRRLEGRRGRSPSGRAQAPFASSSSTSSDSLAASSSAIRDSITSSSASPARTRSSL